MTMRTILAVDIGNTSATFGVFRGKRLAAKFSMLTDRLNPSFPSKHRLFRGPFDAILVSSVVPAKNGVLKKAARQLGAPVRIIGRDLAVPIRNLARNPREVGIDRLLNALEAYRVFGAACVAIDFGTAITFDVVSSKGEYCGGVIAPGVELSLNALFEKTALLPRIRMQRPHRVVGRDTIACIRSGCSYGIGALCDGILRRIQAERGGPLRVIATGGYARYISRYSALIRRIDDDLILKGIQTLDALSLERD